MEAGLDTILRRLRLQTGGSAGAGGRAGSGGGRPQPFYAALDSCPLGLLQLVVVLQSAVQVAVLVAGPAAVLAAVQVVVLAMVQVPVLPVVE
ncbi:hypothetical protein NDU88_002019 [Pleurodeles waltl]|uniref:Uncharacterized protein n=1 Tax=Pleurodeles waltl TaxID=8319 RepID=A0AAV7SBH9_PLEWA|nr:hypothetical protein NDU88_002019 [Pleurodeles waltl]